MPRNQKIHDPGIFKEAENLIKDGLSMRKTANQLEIPFSTLQNHIKGKYVGYDTKFGPDRCLTQDEENSLVNYSNYLYSRGHPLNRKILKRFCSEIIRKSGRQSSINLSSGPSDKWVRGFMHRHKDLSLRKAHPLENSRAVLKQSQIDQYFNLLEETLIRLDLLDDPSRIYNCDETGFSGNINGARKVIVPKGTRHPYQTQVSISGHITLLNAISAAGQMIAPLIIFSGCLPRGDYSSGTPDSWMFRKSDTGYIKSEIFLEWFRDGFLPNIGKRRPVLLVLDNHSSHLSTDVIDIAEKNGVDLLFFPAHSSHLLQPADAVYFHTLKQKVADIAVELGYLGPRTLPRHLFPQVLLHAFNRMLGTTIASCFSDTGIYPLNKKAVVALTSSSPSDIDESLTSIDGPITLPTDNCETCGQSKSNFLVKMGLVSANLANILVPPKTHTVEKKNKNSKTIESARVFPSASSSAKKSVSAAESQKSRKRKQKSTASTVASKPSRQKRAKKSKSSSVQDDNVLCQVCMSNSFEYFWVGCDNCESWSHYECLPSNVQTEADLSLITGCPWLCNVCRQSEE